MFTHRNSFVIAAAFAVALLLAIGGVKAQGQTAFTYQGELTSDDAPLTGQADLRVQLFTAATGGSPVGTAIDLPNTTVTDGLFTALLDFANAFDAGQPRWVEISVRSPAGTGSFTTLTPRQPLTPAPLAQGLAGIPTARGGVETLDQAQESGISSFNFDPGWQSWTAAFTGDLNRAELRLNSNIPRVYFVRVRRGLGTAGPVLGEGSTYVVPGERLKSIPLPNIAVEAGSVYTLEFAAQSVGVELSSAQIPGASGFASPGGASNFWFRTFVTTPSFIDATASSVPWSGITGVPANVAASPWSAVANGIAYNAANVGIGTVAPLAKLHISTASLASSEWQTLFTNTANSTFRGGMRLGDSGFFEVTNNAGNPSPNFARLASTGAWSAVSDARLKTDVTSTEGNLAAAMKLRPVNFRWLSDGSEDFGLIAQEVREVLPKLVVGDEATESLTVSYSQLSVVAIGAIQELKAENDRKQREIDELRARLAAIEAVVRRMEEDGK